MKIMMTLTLGFFLATSPAYADNDFKTYEISTTVDSITYEATVYQPIKVNVKYALIISHNIAGVTPLETANATYFAESGYMVLVPHPFANEMSADVPDTAKVDADYLRYGTAGSSLLNRMIEQFSLPPAIPVFGLGSSQGAVTSIILASQIPQIKAIWTAVGGGNLPYIYSHSLVPQVINFRYHHMKALGILEITTYETYLHQNLKNDPAISCKSITVPFHQLIALYDDMVPTKTQEYLVDECPAHDVKRLSVDHIVGAATVLWDREDIKKFFESSI
ncbi:MAG: hypothetical protein H7177_00725 [Rhizobacter sp.]|nr:hypothetical protein [Bacteriovorax sp.]